MVIRYGLLLLSLLIGLNAHSVPNLPFFESLGSNLSDSPVAKIERTLKIIERDYYDPARIHPHEILESGMRAIAEKIPDVLVTFSDIDKQLKVSIHGQVRPFSYTSVVTALDTIPLFNQVFQWIESEKLLVREHLTKDELEYAVADAILSTLDPHSNVMPPELFKEFETQTEGTFGGIGIVIGMRDGVLTVIAPLPGTPAGRARVISGDRIVKIDGEPSLNMPLNEAVDKLRGKVGTTVKLALQRESGEEYTVDLKREIIEIESVQSTLIVKDKQRIGYLRLKSFQSDTYDELLKHLQALKNRAASGTPGTIDGLVLDLRNNPGGLLDQAVDVADLFLETGPIVMTVRAGGVVEKIQMSNQPGTEANYPIVVLVNGGSASASEIVAAALKDNGRALVAGEQTFGKGSIQSIFDLGNSAAIKMTIAEYWTAGRQSIQSVGIIPHIRLFPVRVSKSLFDLIPNVSVGESDLEKHLENGQSKERKAPFELRYFDEKFFKEAANAAAEDEDDEDKKAFSEQAKREYTKEAYVEGDYWVDFAVKLLTTPASPASKPAFGNLLAHSQSQEDQKLARALAKLGIRWDKSTTHKTEPIRLDTSFKQNGKTVTAFTAGQKATIEVKATNLGKTPLSQVIAATRSPYQHFFFDDREVVFGQIDPGQSVVANTEFKIPATMPTFTEPIIYDIYSGPHRKIGEAKAAFPVIAVDKPRFSFYYTLSDRAGTAPSPLAGNGAVDPGEIIELALTVKNQGKGSAEETQANLKNQSMGEIVLESGRADLAIMKPQTEKKVTLSFQVKPMTTKKEVSVSLLISDSKTGELLDTHLVFPIAIKETISPAPGKWHRPPELIVSRITPAKSVGSQTVFRVEGTLIDDEGLQDLQAFIGEDKQYLETSTDGQKTFNFSITLHPDAKKKERFFYLLGRDQQGLVERAIYGIPLPETS